MRSSSTTAAGTRLVEEDGAPPNERSCSSKEQNEREELVRKEQHTHIFSYTSKIMNGVPTIFFSS